MEEGIVVSICCLTYNHEPYVRECLDSFINQNTEFKYEILIHDDASTDNTASIIREYQDKYPEIIKPILQKENQHSKGIRVSATYNFSRAKGRYIAMCEGDDYWTDPLKLQKQVEFLDNNLDVNFSMGYVENYFQQTGEIRKRKINLPKRKGGLYTRIDYIKFPFSQTSTFVFRNKKLEYPEWANKVHAADKTLVLIATGSGKIKLHNDYFSRYRVHNTNVTHTAKYDVYQKSIETHKYWLNYLGLDKNVLLLKLLILRVKLYRKSAHSNRFFKKIFALLVVIVNRVIRYT